MSMTESWIDFEGDGDEIDTPNKAEDVLNEFRSFATAACSYTWEEKDLSELGRLVDDLWLKVPVLRECFASVTNTQSANNPESEGPTGHPPGRKRRLTPDRTYRGPNMQAAERGRGDSHTSRPGRSAVDSAIGQTYHSITVTKDSNCLVAPPQCAGGMQTSAANGATHSSAAEEPLREVQTRSAAAGGSSAAEVPPKEVQTQSVAGSSAAEEPPEEVQTHSPVADGSSAADEAIHSPAASEPPQEVHAHSAAADVSSAADNPPQEVQTQSVAGSSAAEEDTHSPSAEELPQEAQNHSAAQVQHEIQQELVPLPRSTPSTPMRQIRQGENSPLSETPQTDVFTPPIAEADVLSPLTEVFSTGSSENKGAVILLGNIPSTPSKPAKPQTEPCIAASYQEVGRERSHSTQDSRILLPSSLPRERTLTEMAEDAVDIMHEMERSQSPAEVHLMILGALQGNPSETPGTTAVTKQSGSVPFASSSTTWSTSEWFNMIEAGHARFKKDTILDMIVWMGASEWFDNEIKQAELDAHTTNRGYARKRLATVILDKYLGDASDHLVGNVAFNEGHTSSPNSKNPKRLRLIKTLNNGRKLLKLIKMTHLGILLDRNIWKYIKANEKNTNLIGASFQADEQKLKLLSILGKQVELLVKVGQPDLSQFFDSLASDYIIPREDIFRLCAKYGQENEPVPQGPLEAAITQVIRGVCVMIGKDTLDDDDFIMINGKVELPCGMFGRLRSKTWLPYGDIAAALEMSDRHGAVNHGLSVPLHVNDGKATPISNPLHRWREDIEKSKSNKKTVHICPLNIHNNHYTLLEVNQLEKKIYHFDSLARMGKKGHKTKSLVEKVVQEEFKDLGFKYIEAPTPQQQDEWSCGLMVIRNAKLRMIGRKVGNWDDYVDPDRAIMEVVEGFQAFLKNNALSPKKRPSSKKRRRTNEEHNIQHIRSSQRLKMRD